MESTAIRSDILALKFTGAAVVRNDDVRCAVAEDLDGRARPSVESVRPGAFFRLGSFGFADGLHSWIAFFEFAQCDCTESVGTQIFADGAFHFALFDFVMVGNGADFVATVCLFRCCATDRVGINDWCLLVLHFVRLGASFFFVVLGFDFGFRLFALYHVEVFVVYVFGFFFHVFHNSYFVCVAGTSGQK